MTSVFIRPDMSCSSQLPEKRELVVVKCPFCSAPVLHQSMHASISAPTAYTCRKPLRLHATKQKAQPNGALNAIRMHHQGTAPPVPACHTALHMQQNNNSHVHEHAQRAMSHCSPHDKNTANTQHKTESGQPIFAGTGSQDKASKVTHVACWVLCSRHDMPLHHAACTCPCTMQLAQLSKAHPWKGGQNTRLRNLTQPCMMPSRPPGTTHTRMYTV